MKITSIFVALLMSVSFGFAAEGNKKPDPAAVFAKKDKDGDGKLSKEEFVANAKDAAKAEEAFANRDKDKDGFVSKEEFLAKPAKKK
jgi:Ca2+-binding EF-hand superfamily protein